jgi:ribonuclease P/MRP protein subunit POP5
MALLPTLREKKRYIAFEVISERRLSDPSAVSDAVHQAVQRYLGQKGSSEAGITVIKDRYDAQKQRGIVRVSHTMTGQVIASLTFVTRIADTPVIIRSIGTSGILKKAYNKYIAG